MSGLMKAIDSSGEAVAVAAVENIDGLTTLALEADTIATRNGIDITSGQHKAIRLAVVTGNKIGTLATYTPTLEWKYDGTNYAAIWTAAAALTANGTVIYDLGPGISAGDAVETISMSLPGTFRFTLTVGGTANASHNMDTSVFHGLSL